MKYLLLALFVSLSGCVDSGSSGPDPIVAAPFQPAVSERSFDCRQSDEATFDPGDIAHLLDAFAIEFWFKTEVSDSYEPGQVMPVVMLRPESGCEGFSIGVTHESNGQQGLQVVTHVGDEVGMMLDVARELPATEDGWHHVQVSRLLPAIAGRTFMIWYMYHNGELITSFHRDLIECERTQPVTICPNPNAPELVHFDGLIDDLRISRRVVIPDVQPIAQVSFATLALMRFESLVLVDESPSAFPVSAGRVTLSEQVPDQQAPDQQQ